MKTSDFDYQLPPELIAQTPIEPRDHSQLMVVRRDGGQIEHRPQTVIALGGDMHIVPSRCVRFNPLLRTPTGNSRHNRHTIAIF